MLDIHQGANPDAVPDDGEITVSARNVSVHPRSHKYMQNGNSDEDLRGGLNGITELYIYHSGSYKV